MLKKLIGSQILEVGGNYINIKKDNEKFRLEIISDDGDCCGFSDFETKLLYEPQDLRNPIITEIKEYNDYNSYGGESSLITFFGEQKELAKIKSFAGSGSGCCYGSFVSIKCKLLDIDETLATW